MRAVPKASWPSGLGNVAAKLQRAGWAGGGSGGRLWGAAAAASRNGRPACGSSPHVPPLDSTQAMHPLATPQARSQCSTSSLLRERGPLPRGQERPGKPSSRATSAAGACSPACLMTASLGSPKGLPVPSTHQLGANPVALHHPAVAGGHLAPRLKRPPGLAHQPALEGL